MQVKAVFIERRPASLDLGHFQHIVDQRQQMFTTAGDHPQTFLLLRSERWIAVHQLAKAQDGIEGRAQFVAHIGQEDALGPVGGLGRLLSFFGGLFGLSQFLLSSYPRGDVLHKRG